jgi:hypothetical protein
MDYPVFVEVCGNCGSLITWDAEGKGVCKCGRAELQFMPEEQAIEMGLL